MSQADARPQHSRTGAQSDERAIVWQYPAQDQLQLIFGRCALLRSSRVVRKLPNLPDPFATVSILDSHGDFSTKQDWKEPREASLQPYRNSVGLWAKRARLCSCTQSGLCFVLNALSDWAELSAPTADSA